MKGQVPVERTLDNSILLLKEGYNFIQNRCEEYQTDIFETRLLGKKAICMKGEEAARMFYNTDLFQRSGMIPKRIQKSLFGENAIQTLDGSLHEHRKVLFLSLMTPLKIEKLSKIYRAFWQRKLEGWRTSQHVILFEEAQEILCRAVCEWSGVPLPEQDVTRRAEDFISMVDAFGAVGPRYQKGKKARARAEEWIMEIITEIRNGERKVPEETAIHAMAWHRDASGSLLDVRMASIELINVLRPVVANAYFLAFAPLALHDFPETQQKLTGQRKNKYAEWFCQEVRRFYPFAPFLGAGVRKDFMWKDYHFKAGQMVLLDLYGTNHDPRLWTDPEIFKPERFENWSGGLFDLIPQGGGDPRKGHRCPGEGITLEIMKISVELLVNEMEYEVPNQDLHYSLARMPSLIESGFVMTDVQKKKTYL
ncbi:cytochrome P450 [Bacillus massiliglaciei]|uniref:cytochrome P450 n=1 Tax=Bacillus massiliglaciei TaxID=1816693 RepID=UPI000DA5FCC2|nr:cytochrome P450 [Bacillus massiliglaciei]